LIDAGTGAHLWADRFEGGLEDIFDLQDRVTMSVVGAISPKLEQAEIERAKRKPTESLDAYDYYMRGQAALHHWTFEGNNEALAMFARAVEIDPQFAAAFGMAARCYSQRKTAGWMTDRAREIAETARIAWRAAELGRDDAVALCTAGFGLAYVVGDLENGAALIDRAIALNPNLAWAWYFSGWVKVWLGEPEVAIERATHALRLSPYDPYVFNMQSALAHAHFIAGRDAEALSWAEMALRERSNHHSALRILAASCAMTGRKEQARNAMTRLREIDPALRISNLGNIAPFHRPDDLARLADGLRKAGLPE
jgi:tetratricopeptide (TPR) repeat protein